MQAGEGGCQQIARPGGWLPCLPCRGFQAIGREPAPNSFCRGLPVLCVYSVVAFRPRERSRSAKSTWQLPGRPVLGKQYNATPGMHELLVVTGALEPKQCMHGVRAHLVLVDDTCVGISTWLE